jgi:ABC-type uncharacterized transport system auxiliary subunit
MRRVALIYLLLAATVVIPGCLTPSAPAPIRYVRVEPPRIEYAPARDGAQSLRLRSVTAAAHLDEAMAWRQGPIESGFYDGRRYLELPETVVQRALTESLFISGLFRSSHDSEHPVLEVEVVAFEEQVNGKWAEVGLLATLSLRGQAQWIQRFEGSEKIRGEEAADTARAMGLALGAARADLMEALEGALPPGPR